MIDRFQIDHRKTTLYHPQTYGEMERERDCGKHHLQDNYRLEAELGHQVDNDIVGLSNYLQDDYTCYSNVLLVMKLKLFFLLNSK